MKQMILKVDDDLVEIQEELGMPKLTQSFIPKELNISWSNQPLVGSRSYYNKILILVLSPCSTSEQGDKFKELDLNWEIVATEDEPLSLEELSPYMNDIPVFDEGELVEEVPFSDLSTVQTFAGKRWTL